MGKKKFEIRTHLSSATSIWRVSCWTKSDSPTTSARPAGTGERSWRAEFWRTRRGWTTRTRPCPSAASEIILAGPAAAVVAGVACSERRRRDTIPPKRSSVASVAPTLSWPSSSTSAGCSPGGWCLLVPPRCFPPRRCSVSSASNRSLKYISPASVPESFDRSNRNYLFIYLFITPLLCVPRTNAIKWSRSKLGFWEADISGSIKGTWGKPSLQKCSSSSTKRTWFFTHKLAFLNLCFFSKHLRTIHYLTSTFDDLDIKLCAAPELQEKKDVSRILSGGAFKKRSFAYSFFSFSCFRTDLTYRCVVERQTNRLK